jgi:hypothetical protein
MPGFQSSLRDYTVFSAFHPSDESLGYYQPSLQDGEYGRYSSAAAERMAEHCVVR